MSYKTPNQVAVAAVEAGVAKAGLSPSRMLVGSVLAGAYIGFAGLVGIATTSGLKADTWGTLPSLIFGLVFSLGLILVIIAGSELLTGNMALIPMAVMARRTTGGRLLLSIVIVTIGNLLGSLLVAYVFAVKTGVIGGAHSAAGSSGALTFARLSSIATGKAVTEHSLQIFLRAIACNWLVCLGVWMALAAEDIAGKVLAIVFPITAFVAMGFDHVVANMFFLPAAVFAHVPGIGWAAVWHNLWLAFLGNFVGGGLFVGGAYYFLYLRGARTSPAQGMDAANATEGARGDHLGANAAGPRHSGVAAGTASSTAASTGASTGATQVDPA